MTDPPISRTETTMPKTPDPLPVEAGDFYLDESGRMVFTRRYHLKRGFCCKNGCLHCPWGYRKKQRAEPELPPDFEVRVR